MRDVLIASPAAAYRADLQGRERLGDQDDEWLVAATELHLAASSSTGREQHLARATEVATQIIGAERIAAFARRDWMGERSPIDPLQVLSVTLFRSGGRWLAAALLDDLRRAVPALGPSKLGWILKDRARITWALGDVSGAADRYSYIGHLGRRAGLAALKAHAEIGACTLAQLRGDFPALRVHMGRALGFAEQSGNPAIVRWALMAEMLGTATAGRYDDAILSGWRLYELSVGEGEWEAEALINMGQLLLEMGHPERARAAFAAAVERSAPARLVVSALGGLALSSAHVEAEPTVEWAVREVWRADSGAALRYSVAIAHLECATALRLLGRREEAEQHRHAAVDLARRHAFHEVTFRAGELDTVAALRHPVALAAAAAAVTDRVAGLEPERLPNALAFDTAPV